MAMIMARFLSVYLRSVTSFVIATKKRLTAEIVFPNSTIFESTSKSTVNDCQRFVEMMKMRTESASIPTRNSMM